MLSDFIDTERKEERIRAMNTPVAATTPAVTSSDNSITEAAVTYTAGTESQRLDVARNHDQVMATFSAITKLNSERCISILHKNVVQTNPANAQPAYSEPAIGWNSEDDNSGVQTYGVSNYESTKHLKATKGPPKLAEYGPAAIEHSVDETRE